MKFIISTILFSIFPKLVIATTITYDYDRSTTDFDKIVLDLAVSCKTESIQNINLITGILSIDEKPIFDLLDRELMANYSDLRGLKIDILDDRWIFTGVGGPAHIDYPNELTMIIIKSGPKSAIITADIKKPYTDENIFYRWNCVKFSIHLPKQ